MHRMNEMYIQCLTRETCNERLCSDGTKHLKEGGTRVRVGFNPLDYEWQALLNTETNMFSTSDGEFTSH
jgi:hypothetical protein